MLTAATTVAVAGAHRRADRRDAGFALLDARHPPVRAELARQHPAGRSEVERQQRARRARSSAGRAVRGATARIAAACLRGRTAARSRRSRRGAVSARHAPTRRAGSARRRAARAPPAPARGRTVRRRRAAAARAPRAPRPAGGRSPVAARSPTGGSPSVAGRSATTRENVDRLVEHADTRYSVHIARTLSQIMRSWEDSKARLERLCNEGTSAMTAHTLPEKIWNRHLVHCRARRTRPAVHRPPPRPRGHQPAGV